MKKLFKAENMFDVISVGYNLKIKINTKGFFNSLTRKIPCKPKSNININYIY